jgi:hypothetical protein
MSEMLNTIVPKADQQNFDDFIGIDFKVIKITKVLITNTDQPVSIFFENDNSKPYKPSKGMRRVIIECWGDKKENYIGRSLKLFGNPKVKWAGKEAGGIQIAELSHIDAPKTINLTVAKGKREPFTVKPLIISAIDELKNAGLLSAKNGMESFTNWGKSLTADQKTSLGDYIKELMVIAKNADRKEV